MEWRARFPGERCQVGVARRIVEALFAGTGREGDVGIIVSELTTNAVVHSRSGQDGGWFEVEVAVPFRGSAFLAVTDLGGAGSPQVGARADDDELIVGGLGLRIVRDLAECLEREGSAECGHKVWVRVGLDSDAADGTDSAR